MTDRIGVQVGSIDQLGIGARLLVLVDGAEIVIVNVKGQYRAFRNSCPHQGVAMTHAYVTGTMLPSEAHQYIYGRENEIVRCPLHGWEFDIVTGKFLCDARKALKIYEIKDENGQLILYLNHKPHNVQVKAVYGDGKPIMMVGGQEQ